MKLAEVLERINGQRGFRVSFERREGGVLVSDHFPDRDERPFRTEEIAWCMARQFAAACENAVNIYVIDCNFRPVPGYAEQVLRRYSPGSQLTP